MIRFFVHATSEGMMITEEKGWAVSGLFLIAVRSWSLDFFFQAEDGIRDKLVTGVQTCALPISSCQKESCGQEACC